MASQVIRCLEERAINLGPSASNQEIILADRVEMVAWNEITYLLRVHSHSLVGSSNTILIGAYPQTISNDEPGTVFLAVSFVQVIATLGSATPVPFFTNIGTLPIAYPMVQIFARATRNGSGTIAATVSLDISFKDR